MSISSSSANGVAIALPPKQRSETEQVEIVGSSAAMRQLRMQVRRIGPYFRSVLVSGEAGAGKELVARTLHSMGPGGEFVVHAAAEFEGALAGCEMSLRRTLFLDGIGKMHLEAQDQLLRALKKHERAQGLPESPCLRVIASTREDLRTLASAGRFRQELYQRLAALEIAVPPLRERIEDLPELARFFLRRFAMLYDCGIPEIADDAMERLRLYRWPENVRELEQILRDGVLHSNGGRIEPHHLPVFAKEDDAPSAASAGKGVRLQDVVEQHVLQVLKDCGGNKLRAAEMLGISRSTLYRMLDTGASSIALR
ncbi:MAG: sigma 54-interacting transcriptional regulator [Edaphobacter sp.]